MNERLKQQQLILDKALNIIAFEGLSDAVITKASVNCGFHHMAGQRLFPNGVNDLLNFYNQQLNNDLTKQMQLNDDFATLRTHEKIEWLMLQRFKTLSNHKEAIKRIVAYSTLPWNIKSSQIRLWQNCDTMWQLAGDKSLDFNYYTKRSLLAKIQMQTLIFWLDNDDEIELQEFIQRRITEILKIGKMIGKSKAKITSFVENSADRLLNPHKYRTKKF